LGAATDVLSILQAAVGGPLPIRIRCWDGSVAGDPDAPAALVFVRRRGLRRLLWAPNELGLVRAYISGDVHFEGDIFAVLDLPDVIQRVAHHQSIGLSSRQRLAAAVSAARLGAIGPPPRPPAEEIRRRRGRLHSSARDAQSVSHHYDVGNEFYRLILGPSMVYSCAYWVHEPGPDYHLDERVDAAGLGDLVEIRLQDYRDVDDGPYDAISSVGMSEHVGSAHLRAYSKSLFDLLRPGGRLLNHAIASVRSLSPAVKAQPGFIDSYIFPDGEVVTLSTTLDALEQVGFEVRDVEALREHYGLTLRAWVHNLRESWQEAERLVPPSRARTWLLYLAACALAFEHGNLTIHQVVAVRQGEHGAGRLPFTRDEWLTAAP